MVFGLRRKIVSTETSKETLTHSVPRKTEQAKVGEVMTRTVVTINQNASIQDAASLMTNRGIRGLVAVDGEAVKGIITDRDIVEKVVSKNKSAKNVKVKGIMVPWSRLVTATPDEDLVTITKRMRVAGVGRLPIINEKGRLVGIVTETDLTRVYPGLIEVLYERFEQRSPSFPDRETMSGKCERCGNFSEFLVQIGDEWLCDVCGGEYTAEGARRRL